MKASDLRIDDWVEVKNSTHLKFVQVNGILNNSVFTKSAEYESEEIDISDLKPIQLTPEILEKNGFKKYRICYGVYGWNLMDSDYPVLPFVLVDDFSFGKPGEYMFGVEYEAGEVTGIRELGVIRYIHELQHLLKLFRIEKDILL